METSRRDPPSNASPRTRLIAREGTREMREEAERYRVCQGDVIHFLTRVQDDRFCTRDKSMIRTAPLIETRDRTRLSPARLEHRVALRGQPGDWVIGSVTLHLVSHKSPPSQLNANAGKRITFFRRYRVLLTASDISPRARER